MGFWICWSFHSKLQLVRWLSAFTSYVCSPNQGNLAENGPRKGLIEVRGTFHKEMKGMKETQRIKEGIYHRLKVPCRVRKLWFHSSNWWELICSLSLSLVILNFVRWIVGLAFSFEIGILCFVWFSLFWLWQTALIYSSYLNFILIFRNFYSKKPINEFI